MSEPLLHLCYVRFVIEGIGGGRGAQGVGADLEAKGQGIATYEFVDTIGSDGVVEFACAVVADGAEKGAFGRQGA